MRPITVARLSLAVGVLVLALKYVAYRVTGSVSLYSAALESIVNVVAAGVALFAIRLAERPPDETHPYGHTKAEYFSAVIEGALILFAATEIVRSAWIRFQDPVALSSLGVGLGVSVAASALNGVLAAFLVRTGRQQRSPALVADGQHLWTDVFTTVGVLLGVGLAWWTGWWILDPLLAIIVALNIVRVGWALVRTSVGGLMDESLPHDEMEALQRVIRRHMDGAVEVHALRSRHAGRDVFVEFHLVVPGAMSVDDSHALCDELEAAIREAMPGSVVTIHVEPESKAKHEGRVVRLGA
jgi:cation diffusion facilitator family transporter